MTARRARRPLWITLGALSAAAALLWISSRLDWVRPVYATPLRGHVVLAVSGAAWQPGLVPLAVLALAGVAAALATSGRLRRLVGLLLAASGIWAVLLGVTPRLVDPSSQALAALPETPVGGRAVGLVAAPPWSLLASLGGMLLLAAGGLLVVRGAAMPRLGARYATPAQRRVESDPERGLWDALDAGRDPTDPR